MTLRTTFQLPQWRLARSESRKSSSLLPICTSPDPNSLRLIDRLELAWIGRNLCGVQRDGGGYRRVDLPGRAHGLTHPPAARLLVGGHVLDVALQDRVAVVGDVGLHDRLVERLARWDHPLVGLRELHHRESLAGERLRLRAESPGVIGEERP